MRTALWKLGVAICIALAGCAAPQQSTVNDTAVMGAGEPSTPDGRAIAESLGFHGPRREGQPPR